MTTPPPASSDATSEHLLKEQHDAIDSLSKALGTAHSVGVLTTDNLSDVLHKLTNSKPFSITHPPEDGTLKPWTQFARWWADNYGHIYRHTRDGGAPAWWRYEGKVWRLLSTKDYSITDHINNNLPLLLDTFGRGSRAAVDLDNDREWERASRNDKSAFWAGLRDRLLCETPTPERHLLGADNCVLNLETGEVMDHGPQWNLRAVTAGRYLPDERERLWELLQARFKPVFSPEILVELVRLLGLALTGQAQNWRSIVLILGESGGGKGGVLETIRYALGDRAFQTDPDWILAKKNSEIDATRPTILEKQSAVLMVDEVGGPAAKFDVNNLMRLTGKNAEGARHPNFPLVTGEYVFQFWATAISPPHVSRSSGIARRIAVLPTLGQIRDTELDLAGGKDQDLFDAFVTWGGLMAADVYQEGYGERVPRGDADMVVVILDKMDDLRAWFDAFDDEYISGKRVPDMRDEARSEFGATFPDADFTAMVNSTGKCKVEPRRGDDGRNV